MRKPPTAPAPRSRSSKFHAHFTAASGASMSIDSAGKGRPGVVVAQVAVFVDVRGAGVFHGRGLVRGGGRIVAVTAADLESHALVEEGVAIPPELRRQQVLEREQDRRSTAPGLPAAAVRRLASSPFFGADPRESCGQVPGAGGPRARRAGREQRRRERDAALRSPLLRVARRRADRVTGAPLARDRVESAAIVPVTSIRREVDPCAARSDCRSRSESCWCCWRSRWRSAGTCSSCAASATSGRSPSGSRARTGCCSALGTLFYALLIAGLALLCAWLVREMRHSQRQQAFLDAVTHEMKTPLASLRLYLDTLDRHDPGAEQRAAVPRPHAPGRRAPRAHRRPGARRRARRARPPRAPRTDRAARAARRLRRRGARAVPPAARGAAPRGRRRSRSRSARRRSWRWCSATCSTTR